MSKYKVTETWATKDGKTTFVLKIEKWSFRFWSEDDVWHARIRTFGRTSRAGEVTFDPAVGADEAERIITALAEEKFPEMSAFVASWAARRFLEALLESVGAK